MGWDIPTVVGAGRGIFTEIPDLGYAGWVCYYNGEEASLTYSCKHALVEYREFFPTAPDLKWDDWDLDRGFVCGVKRVGQFDQAKCMMPLPVEANSYLKGEYRWSPSEVENIEQFGFVANGNPAENKWVNFGYVEF